MADEETEEQSGVPQWLPAVKGWSALAALGASAPGLPPGVQSAAVALGVLPVFLEYIQDAPRRAWLRVKAATDEAADRFGDAEKLLERISSDGRLLWLLDTTVDAAARASTEQKARALGRALAEGALANDDARLDEAALMTRIIADVEPIDVRVLARLSDLRHGRNVPPEAEPAANALPAHLRTDGLARVAGLDPVVLDGSLGVLQRHGLIGSVIGAASGGGWHITDLGDRLLDYLPREDRRDPASNEASPMT
jgi:hypothetical protein